MDRVADHGEVDGSYCTGVGVPDLQPMGHVAVDSMVLSYLIRAAHTGYDPQQDPHPRIAKEAKACLQLLLYRVQFWIPPTAALELEQISDPGQRLDHRNLRDDVLAEIPTPSAADTRALLLRRNELMQFHPGANDCRILAEVELFDDRLHTLLTFDGEFRKRLTGRTRVTLTSPSEHFVSLGIIPGTPLPLLLSGSDSCSNQDWCIAGDL